MERAPAGKYTLAVVLVATLALSLLAARASSHPKTDKIVMRNGDVLTVEIKELTRGKLRVKTDDMGTLDIEWDKIRGLHSKYYFQVSSTGGDVYYGALEMAEDSKTLRIVMLDAVAGISQESVVEILPIERNFVSRLDGSLSLGFDFTKASQVAQLTFDWSSIYRGERDVFDLKLSALMTDRREEDGISQRADLSFGWNHLLGRKKWFTNSSVGYQRNDELGLRNRLILTGGMGLNVLRSNHNLLRTSLGIAWNAEESTDSSQTRQSLEGVLSVDYSVFQYDSPKTDVVTKLDVFPSLTEERYRIEFDIKLRREIVSDFFIELRYYTSADTNSPATSGWKSDYGFITGVSWSY